MAKKVVSLTEKWELAEDLQKIYSVSEQHVYRLLVLNRQTKPYVHVIYRKQRMFLYAYIH